MPERQPFTEKKKEENKDWEIWEMISRNAPAFGMPHKPGYNCKRYKCNIHSVIRRSDGAIFKIGDKIEYRMAGENNWDQVWPAEIGGIKKVITHKGDEEIEFEIKEEGTCNVARKFIENIRHPQPSITNTDRIDKVYTKKEMDKAIEDAIIKNAETQLPFAIVRLIEELSKDKSEGSYYYSWQANIAMAFQDEYRKEFGHSDKMSVFIHEVANNAAKAFLDMLCHQPKPEAKPSK